MTMRRSAVLLVALLAAATPPACSAATGAPTVRTVAITIHYSHFSLARLRVAAGENVRFTITNTDPIDHEFILGDQAVQDREEAGTDLVHGHKPGGLGGNCKGECEDRHDDSDKSARGFHFHG